MLATSARQTIEVEANTTLAALLVNVQMDPTILIMMTERKRCGWRRSLSSHWKVIRSARAFVKGIKLKPSTGVKANGILAASTERTGMVPTISSMMMAIAIAE